MSAIDQSWSPYTADESQLWDDGGFIDAAVNEDREPAEVTALREAAAHMSAVVERCAWRTPLQVHGPSPSLTQWFLDNGATPKPYAAGSASLRHSFCGVPVVLYVCVSDEAWALLPAEEVAIVGPEDGDGDAA